MLCLRGSTGNGRRQTGSDAPGLAPHVKCSARLSKTSGRVPHLFAEVPPAVVSGTESIQPVTLAVTLLVVAGCC